MLKQMTYVVMVLTSLSLSSGYRFRAHLIGRKRRFSYRPSKYDRDKYSDWPMPYGYSTYGANQLQDSDKLIGYIKYLGQKSKYDRKSYLGFENNIPPFYDFGKQIFTYGSKLYRRPQFGMHGRKRHIATFHKQYKHHGYRFDKPKIGRSEYMGSNFESGATHFLKPKTDPTFMFNKGSYAYATKYGYPNYDRRSPMYGTIGPAEDYAIKNHPPYRAMLPIQMMTSPGSNLDKSYSLDSTHAQSKVRGLPKVVTLTNHSRHSGSDLDNSNAVRVYEVRQVEIPVTFPVEKSSDSISHEFVKDSQLPKSGTSVPEFADVGIASRALPKFTEFRTASRALPKFIEFGTTPRSLPEFADVEHGSLDISIHLPQPGPYELCRPPNHVTCGARPPWKEVDGMDDWCEYNCAAESYFRYCDDVRCKCHCDSSYSVLWTYYKGR